MKILISPAKSLNFERDLPTNAYTQPHFLSQAQQLNSALREKSPASLQDLMGISEKLASLNWERNQVFETPFTSTNARPALFAFNGDVYSGIDAYTLSEKAQEVAQEKLLILSGLYGMLKPLDLMQPYRLEMGTSFGVAGHKNLYTFWKGQLTSFLRESLNQNELVVNLASKEYALALDFSALETPGLIRLTLEKESFLLVAMALIGGVLGGYYGSKKINNQKLRYILAFVLIIACAKLFFF